METLFAKPMHFGFATVFEQSNVVSQMKAYLFLMALALAAFTASGEVVLYKQSVTIKVTGGGVAPYTFHLGGWNCFESSTGRVAYVDALQKPRRIQIHVLEDYLLDSADIVVNGAPRKCSFFSDRVGSFYGAYSARGNGADTILNIGKTNAPLEFPKTWTISGSYAFPKEIREFSGQLYFDEETTRFCNDRGMSFEDAIAFLKNKLIEKGYFSYD